MNSRKSSTTCANSGLSARNSLESPCTANASAGMSRSGLIWRWKVWPVGMRLKISIQPISTSRSPRSGSRPVVSVSRTISRISCNRTFDESGSSLRHLSSLIENVPDSRTHRVEAVRSIHHEIRTFALFGVRQLPRQDGVELLDSHIVARQDSLPLNFRRGRDHDHRIDAFLAAGLKQQRHIDHGDGRT